MAWLRPQSHSRQLRQPPASPADHAELPEPGVTARRSQRRAAVFGAGRDPREPDRPDTAAAVATGLLAAARDDGILLDTRAGTEFFAVSPDTVTWLGAPVTPEALRRGDPVTVR